MDKRLNLLIILVFIILGFIFVKKAQAAEMSLGVNYSRLNYSANNIPVDFNPTALIFKLESKVNENFAIQGRLGMGITDNCKGISGLEACFRLNNMLGIYAKGIAPVSEKFSFHGMVGYTMGTGTATLSDGIDKISNSDSNSDLSFGVGFEVRMSEHSSFNLDYIKYMSKSDFDISAIEAGFNVYY